MNQNEINRIVNRYIAKILNRMNEVMDVPDLIVDDVKRQLHYLKNDLIEEIRREPANGERYPQK